jgi:hypothetical protein
MDIARPRFVLQSPHHAATVRAPLSLPPDAVRPRLLPVRPVVQPAVPADQGLITCEPAGRRVEARRIDPQRAGAGGALQGQPGHGAQGHRRTGGRQPAGAPPGQGHLRGHPCREQIQYRFLRLMPDDGTAAPAACSAASWTAAACARRPRWRAALGLKAGEAGGAGAPPLLAAQRRTASRGAGRHLAARRAVQGPDGRAPGRLRGPMYGLFEAEFGVRMIRAEEKIRAVAADAASGRCWAWPPGARCSAWSGCRSPTATSRWNCAAACTTPSAPLPQ